MYVCNTEKNDEITCSKKSLTVRHGEVEKEKIEEEISEGWVTSFTPGVELSFGTYEGWVAATLTFGGGLFWGGEGTSETGEVVQPLTSSHLLRFSHREVAFNFTSQRFFSSLEKFRSTKPHVMAIC